MSDINQSSENNRPKIERDSTYWLNLDHYEQSPEFLKLAETEFQSSPLREEENAQGDGARDGVARREFLKLMGASLAMASAGCLRRPIQNVVPYNKQPEEVVLGVPNFYSSTFFDGSEAQGVLMKTREGRPIKIEGRVDFPLHRGTSIRAQAAVLNLYDPDRLRGPQKNLFNEKRTNKDTIGIALSDADTEISEQLKKGQVVVLTGALPGPAQQSAVADFCQSFGARHVTFEPLSHEEIRSGQAASYGAESVPFHRFDKAKMIVSIDADFLGTWLAPTTYSSQFGLSRKNVEKMSRLVSFDSTYSLTGANADIRVRIKPSQQFLVVMGILHELVVKNGWAGSGNPAFREVLSSYSNVAEQLKMDPALLAEIAKDLWSNRGESLVVAGGLTTLTSQSVELQIAVNFLNHVLENDGRTVLSGSSTQKRLKGSWAALFELIQDMNEGKVQTLIMHGVNPGYLFAGSTQFIDALKKVKMVVSTADRMDESASYAHIVIPQTHSFEEWGDSEAAPGFFMIQQPTIRPMYDCRSFGDSLIAWTKAAGRGGRLGGVDDFYSYLRGIWREQVLPATSKGSSFDDFWYQALQNGYVGEVPSSSSARNFNNTALGQIKPSAAAGAETEIAIYVKPTIGDGSKSNVSWLHELPDPVSKIAWDNYVSVSIAFAKKHNLKQAELVELTVGEFKVTLPVNIQPGLHDEVMAVAVGYGRTKAGKVANGVGQNVYPIIKLAQVGGKNSPVASGQPVQFKKVSGFYELANPQGGQSMEGRQIVVEATLEEYKKKKDANIHRHHIWSLWSGHQYNGHKWGMAVDLNSCTGCNACVVSCQSENNIPVVGKKYMLRGREMHWIRIDRYYVGSPETAEAVFQPVMCQHCDNAPCETVCPVVATVHTDDGLNAMVYNRCVGTRYCSNNCPYKVRRFNWFNYSAENEAKPLNLAMNPEVTVRTRGVMEKCTFCVQRIKSGKEAAKKQERKLQDGEIKTACQTACPTNAIEFGDMNDPESAVSKKFKEERSYMLLEEWNAAPAVRYMTKIRNNGQEKRHQGSHGDHA